VVNRRPDRLLEPTELVVQPGRLEFPPNGPHLADVDPTNPEVFREKAFQEREVQLECLLRLAVETCRRNSARAEGSACHSRALPPHIVHHANRLEAAVRVDVEVVRLRDAWIRGFESER